MATTVDAKLLRATKFPSEFNQKVDMQKVNLEVMKKWIAGKISDILGNEDDVVIELCFNLIEGARYPDIKKLQIQLTGFLDKDTATFCKELWKLCLSAQSNPQGVPKELLEAKKLELIQEKIDAEKAAEEARRRRDIDQRRERDLDRIRNRERGERGRGRGDSYRGGRGDRGFDQGPRDYNRRESRYSRSPPPRRRDSRDRASFREPPTRDIYVPRGRGDDRRSSDRQRSLSVSASPPRRRRRRSPSMSLSPAVKQQRSVSRSPVSERYRRSDRGRAGGRRGKSSERYSRRRLSSTSASSRSRSPRPRKRRRSESMSVTPPPRSRRRRSSSSRSRSPLPSRSPSAERSSKRTRHSHGHNSARDDDTRTKYSSTKSRKREAHDSRRLSRSVSSSRSASPPRRRRRSFSRSTSRELGDKERKRRRSLERYTPAKRRSSSLASPVDSKNRRANSSEVEDTSITPSHGASKQRQAIRNGDDVAPAETDETKLPEKQANELREKLLRDKIMKMRTSSISS